jgi:hypothetical protein
MIAESEVQEAVYALLNANTTLAGEVTGVFDLNNVPKDQAFPYVVLGETSMVPWDVFGGDGEDMVLTIHSWSTYNGKRELATVRGEIKKTLHHTDLDMPDFTGTLKHDIGNAMSDDTSGTKLMHGTDRYRVRVRAKG